MNEVFQFSSNLDKMHKRRVTMQDGRRYMMFYTFGEEQDEVTKENKEQQATAKATKEKDV